MEREKGQEQEIKHEEIQPIDIYSSDKPEDKVATQADTDAILDACKELTKVVGDLKAEWAKWRKAGKFILILGLTCTVGSGIIA